MPKSNDSSSKKLDFTSEMKEGSNEQNQNITSFERKFSSRFSAEKTFRKRSKFSTLTPLALIIRSLANDFGKKFGLERVKIIYEWEAIIGPEFATHSSPQRIKIENDKRVLIIASNNSSAAAMLSFAQGLITDKINSYFGYRVIDAIKVLN